jgi:pyrroline-5-carboxylate reductase
VAFDAVEARVREVEEEFGVDVAGSCREVAQGCRVVFVAVKPGDMEGVLREMGSVAEEGHLIVSVAAGVGIDKMVGWFGKGGVIRVMPNTPCLVGEGAMGVSVGDGVGKEDLEMVVGWLERLGVVRVVPEKLLDAVTGLSGSGPAYVYLMIEAMADGGVLAGLPRGLAADLAVQTVMGAAKMVKETGVHTAVLREQVTSPGGTTAAGLLALEDGCLKATVMKAVRDAANRSKEMGK